MSLFTVFVVTLSVFLLVIAGMAIGVIVGRRRISGSCGGLNQGGSEGQTSCSICTSPSDSCEQRQAAQEAKENASEQQSCSEGDNTCGTSDCDKEAMNASSRR